MTGVTAAYDFTGTSAALVGLKCADGGRARVYANGILNGTVDFYSVTARNRAVLLTVNDLRAGTHTMEV
mgnify:CR=1 FL=1